MLLWFNGLCTNVPSSTISLLITLPMAFLCRGRDVN